MRPGAIVIGVASVALFGLALATHARAARRERRALAKEVRARAGSQRSAQARTTLLGMVSHELRTPLQTLVANLDLLSQPLAPDEFAPVVARMNRAVDLISGRLDNIARYASVESGARPVAQDRFRIAEVLRCVAGEHVLQASQNAQTILVEVAEGADIAVRGDAARLRQILDNYLANAIKYAGHGTIRIGAALKGGEGGGPYPAAAPMVEAFVEDHGPGVPESERLAVWEPYYRGRRGCSQAEGSGLGLAVVKLLASAAGWEVGVRSGVDGTTVFHVRFPREPGTGQDPSPARSGDDMDGLP